MDWSVGSNFRIYYHFNDVDKTTSWEIPVLDIIFEPKEGTIYDMDLVLVETSSRKETDNECLDDSVETQVIADEVNAVASVNNNCMEVEVKK